MFKRYFLPFILLLALTSNGVAQFSKYKTNPLSNTILLSLGGGVSHSETDFTNSDLGFYGSGAAEYFFTTDKNLFLGLKLESGYSQLSGNSTSNKFETDLLSFGPALTLNYQINKNIFPYIGLGIKHLWYSDFTATDLTGELGVRFLVSRYFAINGNVSFNFISEDNIDKLPISGSSNDFFSTFSIGFSYAVDLTVEDDLDGDGIRNQFDSCPEQAEDFDNFEDADGCPEFDNDLDGIIDSKDNCVNEAEDFDGFEDQDGCPDYDNDGDNISDEKDECPEMAEDFDGFEDADGCPELDNDQDGILDANDQCPNVAENFNNYQDTDGCPDEIPETIQVEEIKPDNEEPKNSTEPKNKVRVSIPNEFLLDGENVFSSNTSNIQRSYYRELNEIAEMMKSNTSFKWRIEGHLDNSGSQAERKALSASMASSVMEYLVSRGVSSKSFQVIGLSDEYPLAPNSTIQGRLKNRRVEIKRIR
jgi:outer membrane protein OmpA-like peptidoglycan-associated protein